MVNTSYRDFKQTTLKSFLPNEPDLPSGYVSISNGTFQRGLLYEIPNADPVASGEPSHVIDTRFEPDRSDFTMTSGDSIDLIIYGGRKNYGIIDQSLHDGIPPGSAIFNSDDNAEVTIEAQSYGLMVMTPHDSIGRKAYHIIDGPEFAYYSKDLKLVVDPEIRDASGNILTELELHLNEDTNTPDRVIITYYAGVEDYDVSWEIVTGSGTFIASGPIILIPADVIGETTGTVNVTGLYGNVDSIPITILP